jgi:hypothetical protein
MNNVGDGGMCSCSQKCLFLCVGPDCCDFQAALGQCQTDPNCLSLGGG